jgi:hypothetical protein
VTIHKARLKAVFAALGALLRGGRLSLTELGRSIGGAVDAKHSIKRIDRLLGNRHLHAEVAIWFATIAEALLAGIRRPLIVVDWTEVGPEHVALVAAVPAGGRALMIYSEVHPLRLLSNSKVERRFLETLAKQVLPMSCQPIIETDAGFKNPWFQVVRKLGWDFNGRVAAGVLVIEADADSATRKDREAWSRADSLHSRATSKPSDIGCHTLAKSNPLDVRLVLVKKHKKGRKGSKKVTRKGVHPGSTVYKKYQRRAREPWLLATSLCHQSAKQIVALYSQRMQIEETFRDTKNHRFGWSFEDARSNRVERLQVLLLLAALGALGLHLVGVAAERMKLHLRYQANTIRTRRVLSFFALGKMLVTRDKSEVITTDSLEEALEEVRRVLRSNGC